MPTATSLSGWKLLNVGPATTTFSAPASCSTAYRTMIAAATEATAPQWNAQCPWLPPVGCNPSGTVVNSLISSAGGNKPTDGLFVVYQSPGLVCPYGQSTVGAAEKLNPTSTSISGAFDVSKAIPTDPGIPLFVPQLAAILGALDTAETAILCCPSSYTAADGACYSAIPTSSFTPTRGCRVEGPGENFGTVNGTFTVGGKPFTGEVLTITGTQTLSTVSTTFAPSEVTSYVGVAVEGMGILIHRASDLATTSAPKPSNAGSATGPPASSTSKSSAASPPNKNKNIQAFALVSWFIVFVLGAGVIV